VQIPTTPLGIYKIILMSLTWGVAPFCDRLCVI
jgi:hypothetical protein